ncbi:hypothetical protein [Streptomyces sp. NPDC002159]
MKRIEATELSGAPYVAQLNISSDEAIDRWGPAEITSDDLGPWLTYVFKLHNGTKAALVREVENAPFDGFILTMDTAATPEDALAQFPAASGLPRGKVTHISGH